MTIRPQFNRRTVLAMLAAAGLTAPGHAFASRPAGAGPVLRSLLRAQRMSAAHLGRAWLAMTPAEADPATLVHLLETSTPGVAGPARNGDLAAVQAALSTHIAADFAAGRTAELDGWVMSHTEARLCALQALTAASTGAASS